MGFEGPTWKGPGMDIRPPNSKAVMLEATQEFYLAPNIRLKQGQFVHYEKGRRVVFIHCGYDPHSDAESTDIEAVEGALKDGWLKRWPRKRST